MAIKSEKSAHFPTKREIADFILSSPKPVGKREIARAFNITGDARVALKRILAELKEEGVVAKGERRRVAAPGALQEVIVAEIASIDEGGELQAKPAKWDVEDKGPAPEILVLADRAGKRAPGIGDRVLVRLTRTGETSYEAKVIRRLEQASRTVFGALLRMPDGGLRLLPADRRARSEFVVAPDDVGEARDGDLVVARTLPGQALGLPKAKVIKRLGNNEAPSALTELAIHAHGIPTEFPAAAVAQAERAAPPTLDGRVDLRDIPFVTIDGEDARDFDDAVQAEPDDGADNEGGWRLRVAIADVAHYVRPGDVLDRAAYERGNSAYFPDRVVPMLPEALSNGLCSLRPNEDRACLAVEMRIDAKGNLLDHKFVRGLMRSQARLTYTQVEAARNGTADEVTAPLLDSVIRPLYGAYEALLAARETRGALEIDMPERRVILDDDGGIMDVRPRPRLDSHRLIEEFMIAANVAAAATLIRKRRPCLFRVHDQPPADKLDALRQYLGTLGYKMAPARHVHPSHLNFILRAVEEKPIAHQVNLSVLRSQSQAVYSAENIGHFGLSLEHYAHFTSPIRRYSDLIVHRLLISALKLGPDGLPRDAEADLEAAGEHLSFTERRAEAAEREVQQRLMVVYLADKVGATFAARIVNVTHFGLFIELEDSAAEGFVPMASLGDEFFLFDEERQSVIGERSGQRYALGDSVVARLKEADIIAGGLLFELLEGGTRGRAPSKGMAKRLRALSRARAQERLRGKRQRTGSASQRAARRGGRGGTKPSPRRRK